MLEILAGVFLLVVFWLLVWQFAIWAENIVTRFFAWRRHRRLARARRRGSWLP